MIDAVSVERLIKLRALMLSKTEAARRLSMALRMTNAHHHDEVTNAAVAYLGAELDLDSEGINRLNSELAGHLEQASNALRTEMDDKLEDGCKNIWYAIPRGDKCPHCTAHHGINLSSNSPWRLDTGVECRNCGKRFSILLWTASTTIPE